MPRVAVEEVVTKLFSGDENLAEASGIFPIGFNREVKKFEGAVNGGGSTGCVTLSGPFERTRDFTADIAHLIDDGIFAPVGAQFFAMNVV